MENIIGYSWHGEGYEYDLFYRDNVLIERNKISGEEKVADLKHVAFALTSPWDKIRYYEKDGKHHWYSIVYDFIEFVVWADTIEELINLVACIISDAYEDVEFE